MLILADRLSARGGADQHLLALIPELKLRYRTLLAVGRDDGTLQGPAKGRLGSYCRLKGLNRSGLNRRGKQGALRRLEKLVWQFNPDIIHMQNIMDPCLLKAVAATQKAVLTVQDHRLFCPGRGKLKKNLTLCFEPMGPDCLTCLEDLDYGSKMLELTQKRLQAARGMKAIIVLSRYMARELRKSWIKSGGAFPDPHVVPPFINKSTPALNKTRGGHHLLAGRMVRQKGIDVAVKARKLLKNPLPLIVAGAGPLQGVLQKSAQKEPENLIIKPWQSPNSLQNLLRNAVSLWLPSLWAEPFGIVGVEALAMGKPVVASNIGGVPDWLINGKNGLLVKPGDAKGLADAADQLSQNPALSAQLGEWGRKNVLSKYQLQNIIPKMLNIYEKVIQA